MLNYIHFQFPAGKNKSIGFTLSPSTRTHYHIKDLGINDENIVTENRKEFKLMNIYLVIKALHSVIQSVDFQLFQHNQQNSLTDTPII